MKTCSTCKEELPLKEFYFRKDTGKYRPSCKMCMYNKNKPVKDAYNKRYWRDNKEKEKKRYAKWYEDTFNKRANIRTEKHLVRTYGLTLDDYRRMYEEQSNSCKICGNDETVCRNGKVKNLAVDHCHETGKVRGLLCQNCNRALGLFKENISSLKAAIIYLEEHTND